MNNSKFIVSAVVESDLSHKDKLFSKNNPWIASGNEFILKDDGNKYSMRELFGSEDDGLGDAHHLREAY